METSLCEEIVQNLFCNNNNLCAYMIQVYLSLFGNVCFQGNVIIISESYKSRNNVPRETKLKVKVERMLMHPVAGLVSNYIGLL